MKKIISTLLVVVVLFNFILCSDSYADEQFKGTDSITTDSITSSDQESIVNEGTTSFLGSLVNLTWGLLGTIFGTITGILATVVNVFPMLLQVLMGATTSDSSDMHLFTIERTVFNQIGLFNINYFDLQEGELTYTVGNETIAVPNEVKILRESIAKWFVIMRLLAIILSLVILIYVGIRMALSVLASEKAKYKQMLFGWIESIVLLFVLHYIISFIINFSESLVNILYNIKSDLYGSGGTNFEEDVIDKVTSFLGFSSGWTYTLYSIVYWVLIFIQTQFYISYFKRQIVMGFLICIAPLVIIIYPIDKIGDGKSQAFSIWLREIAINALIQPIHAMIYLVFLFTAGEIAKYSIIVAFIFLLFLTKVEKIVLSLFNIRNTASLKPVGDERKKNGG